MKKLTFGFWFRSGKFGLNECDKCESILLETGVEFEKIKDYYIFVRETFNDEDSKELRKKELMDLMWDNKITRYVILNGEE